LGRSRSSADAHGYDDLDEFRDEPWVPISRSAPLVSSANLAYIEAVLAKCVALRLSKLWPEETVIRPRGWLDNFADEDKTAAAVLLDGFNRKRRGEWNAPVPAPSRRSVA
jgi:hypothetical protein